ncbi:MAG TPA: SRPBCC family protein [Pseudonocardia sp.]|jgi:phenylpropionate dioxygenase-like ring-hydroxylating dioxygenase large terminal subunit|nr:SRPBCC family protein [Pseudonocardia sp.]
MPTTIDPDEIRRLYDSAAGVIKPTIYTDEAIFRAELDQIFARTWVLLCPEQQIPRPGDFFNTYVGADRVMVVRQKDGSVKGLLNQCRHRGNELERADFGNRKMFACSYHGWAYDLAGNLRSVPREELSFPDGFDKSAWGCRSMAQVDTYKGLVFGTWDPTAPPLADYLGDGAWYADIFLDRWDDGQQLMGGVSKWIIKANWKLIVEQFTYDLLHAENAHPAAFLASVPPDFDRSQMKLPSNGVQFSSPSGHGAGLWQDKGPVLDVVAGPEGRDHWRASYPEVERRLGTARADVSVVTVNLFPTCAMFDPTRQLRTVHPVGPDESEIWAWNFVPACASDEVKRSWSVNTIRAFGAGGLFEADDSTMWRGIQRTLRGTIGRSTPMAVAMGHRYSEGPSPDFPGRVADLTSEMSARGFYDRWLDLLTCETWADIDQAAKARFAEGARV